MIWKTRFALTLLVSALAVSSAFTQDATATPAPDLNAEATAPVVPTWAATRIVPETQEITPPSADETETTVGSLTLIHPKTWFATLGPDGKTLFTNVNIFSLPPNTELPPETVLAQIEVFSTSQLPPEMGSVMYATDILQALPTQAGQAAPDIREVAVNGVVLGRANFSSPESDNVIYIRLLDEETFMLAVVGSITPGNVAENEATFERALSSVQIIADAPFAEDTARYDKLSQSTSPEGFPQLGDPNAPVKIIEIGSFDCPACRSFHDLVIPVLLERIEKGEVFFTYVPVYGTGSLPRGQRAALAALCVAEQGQFWAYHDGLYGWQDFGGLAFLDARLANGVTALNLDSAAFETCLETEATLPILQAAATFVQGLPAFNGTPTVLLNGEEINWSRLPTLIDAALLGTSVTQESAPAAQATTEAAAPATATATTQP